MSDTETPVEVDVKHKSVRAESGLLIHTFAVNQETVELTRDEVKAIAKLIRLKERNAGPKEIITAGDFVFRKWINAKDGTYLFVSRGHSSVKLYAAGRPKVKDDCAKLKALGLKPKIESYVAPVANASGVDQEETE